MCVCVFLIFFFFLDTSRGNGWQRVQRGRKEILEGLEVEEIKGRQHFFFNFIFFAPGNRSRAAAGMGGLGLVSSWCFSSVAARESSWKNRQGRREGIRRANLQDPGVKV